MENHINESLLMVCGELMKLIPADIQIGCTGLKCPGESETTEKPVGTMFLYGIKGTC